MKARLTKTGIEKIPEPPRDKQTGVFDGVLTGSGVRLPDKNATFSVPGRVGGRPVRATPGRSGVIGPEIARRVHGRRESQRGQKKKG